MKKLFLLSFAGNVFAHSGLESSTPQNGEVITEGSGAKISKQL